MVLISTFAQRCPKTTISCRVAFSPILLITVLIHALECEGYTQPGVRFLLLLPFLFLYLVHSPFINQFCFSSLHVSVLLVFWCGGDSSVLPSTLSSLFFRRDHGEWCRLETASWRVDLDARGTEKGNGVIPSELDQGLVKQFPSFKAGPGTFKCVPKKMLKCFLLLPSWNEGFCCCFPALLPFPCYPFHYPFVVFRLLDQNIQ